MRWALRVTCLSFKREGAETKKSLVPWVRLGQASLVEAPESSRRRVHEFLCIHDRGDGRRGRATLSGAVPTTTHRPRTAAAHQDAAIADGGAPL